MIRAFEAEQRVTTRDQHCINGPVFAPPTEFHMAGTIRGLLRASARLVSYFADRGFVQSVLVKHVAICGTVGHHVCEILDICRRNFVLVDNLVNGFSFDRGIVFHDILDKILLNLSQVSQERAFISALHWFGLS